MVLAVFFGTTVVSSFTNLDVGVRENIARQMRAFGPNIVVRPSYEGLPLEFAGIQLSPPQKSMLEEEIKNIKKIFWKKQYLKAGSLSFHNSQGEGKKSSCCWNLV